MPQAADGKVYGAIDVGTNAVRLKLARQVRNGALLTLHHQRDPVRPGEGVFETGAMPRHVADRLVRTLRGYSVICRRHHARVRAVATSAVREAHNRDELVKRVRDETGLLLDVVSGMEEARLICLGVLQGASPHQRSLCVDIGGGSTEVAVAVGERPRQLWSVAIGSVRLTDTFDASRRVSPQQLRLMREYAAEAMQEGIPAPLPGLPRNALGSSGTIQALVAFAAPAVAGAGGPRQASARRISRAVDELAEMGAQGLRERFDPRRADIIVAGAVVLESVMQHLRIDGMTAVERGLRDGILVDLVRGRAERQWDHSLAEAALALGRRFLFDERHAEQVAKIALSLFDDLAPLHRLPAATRPYLEVAAWLHDIGHAVSYQRHHKHTYYLIQNADIPGLADHERELVARIARYHRRSVPAPMHPMLSDLGLAEQRLVRKLATLLRLADSLDRSHHQPVVEIRSAVNRSAVIVHLKARAPVELELWDTAHEVELFGKVFRRRLQVRVGR